MRHLLFILACIGCLTAASGAHAAVRVGTPAVVTRVPGEASLLDARALPEGGDAYATFAHEIGRNVYRVVFRDRRGRVHGFVVPSVAGQIHEAIRLVPLEDGGAMALWDDEGANRVRGRAWTAAGALGPIVTVLSGVETTHSADNDTAQWVVRHDGRGTVVVASTGARTGDPASVIAAIRDPGRSFGPQQVVFAGGDGVLQRQLALTPIAADGSVQLTWGPESGDGAPGGIATRAARTATFGAAASQVYTAPTTVLTRAHRTAITQDGSIVTIGPSVAARCPCFRPQLLRWGRVERLVLIASGDASRRGVYVATADADGVFVRATRLTRTTSILPIRGVRAGEVGLAGMQTGGATTGSRLFVARAGDDVPRSRRAPHVTLAGAGFAGRDRRLRISVSCDRVCRVGSPTALDPFSPVTRAFRVPARRTRVTVVISARDDAGHATRVRATYRRTRVGASSSLWRLVARRTTTG